MTHEKIPSQCNKCNAPLRMKFYDYLIDGRIFTVKKATRSCECDPKTRVDFKYVENHQMRG